MPHRQPVQLVPVKLPLRHEPFHEGHETVVVGMFDEVRHLMNEDVLETFKGFPGEVGIQADIPGFRITASPAGLHVLDEDLFYIDAQAGFPFGNQLRECGTDLVPKPLDHDLIPRFLTGTRPHIELHGAVLELYAVCRVFLNNLEKIPLPPYVMTFPVDEFPRRFPLLFPELLQLLLDPAELRGVIEVREVGELVLFGKRPDDLHVDLVADIGFPLSFTMSAKLAPFGMVMGA